MTDPSYLVTTRQSYDAVAASYAERVPSSFAADPLGRAMLGAFAELVAAVGKPVADLGCGPGHVTAHLGSLGLTAFGVDLSPRMVELARRTHPEIGFDVGSMTALDLPDAGLGGVVAWWSIVHIPPDVLPTVFAEFHRTLTAGGHVALGFHAGDERRRPGRAYGMPVTFDSYRHPPDRVAAALEDAGLAVTARLVAAGSRCPQATLLARKEA